MDFVVTLQECVRASGISFLLTSTRIKNDCLVTPGEIHEKPMFITLGNRPETGLVGPRGTTKMSLFFFIFFNINVTILLSPLAKQKMVTGGTRTRAHFELVVFTDRLNHSAISAWFP